MICRIIRTKGGFYLTLINVIHTPTGIVLSGDSRTSGNGFVVSDSTNKVFLLFNRIGVVTAGSAYINNMPVEHYIREFEMIHLENNSEMSVFNIADELYEFFSQLSNQNVFFLLAGYDGAVQHLYHFVTIGEKQITRSNINNEGQIIYGAAWQGDTEIVSRLTSNIMMPLYDAMNIQDAIDFSRHLIRTTIDQLRFEPRFPTVGGEIDTLAIQPAGGFYIYKKGLTYR